MTSTSSAAFTAWLSTSTSLAPNTKIIFDNTVLNIGDHYDTTSGIFTCPVDGVYIFSLTITHDIIQPLVQMVVNDGEVETIYGIPYTFYDDTYDQGSMTVLAQCQQGQQAYAKAIHGDLLGGPKYNVFSGALLHLLY